MKKATKNTNEETILKLRTILLDNCYGWDDMLKREKYTCYTIQKKHSKVDYFSRAKKAFLELGYEPEVQSENEEFITYMLPDYF